jgi:hypothetical protein
MRKSVYSVFLAVLVALPLVGCIDIANSGNRGFLTINLGSAPGGARNIFNSGDLAGFSYTLVLSGPGGASQTVALAPGKTSLSISLEAGIWRIDVSAYDTAKGDRLSGTGFAETSIHSGQTSSAAIKMNIAFETYYAASAGSDSNDGLTPDAPFETLNYAITKAAFGNSDISVITVLDNITVSSGIGVSKPSSSQQRPLVIRGNPEGSPVVIDTTDTNLFTISGSQVLFEDLSISNTGTSGQIFDIDNSRVILNNVAVTTNSSASGSGAHVASDAELVLRGTTSFPATAEKGNIYLDKGTGIYPALVLGNLTSAEPVIGQIKLSGSLSDAESSAAQILKGENGGSVASHSGHFELVGNGGAYEIDSTGKVVVTGTGTEDITPPAIISLSFGSLYTNTPSSVNLNITVFETGSGLKTLTLGGSGFTPSGSVTGPGGNSDFTYSDNTITFASPENLKQSSNFTMSIPGNLTGGNGVKTVSITGATDANSNPATSSLSANVFLDTVAPSFSGALINGGDATTSSPSVTYTVTLTEAGSGLTSLTVSGFDSITSADIGGQTGTVSDLTITFSSGTTTSGTLTIIGTLPAVDGTKIIKITDAQDHAGNITSGAETTSSTSITLDTAVPTITTLSLSGTYSGANPVYATTNIKVELTGTDGGSGIAKYLVISSAGSLSGKPGADSSDWKNEAEDDLYPISGLGNIEAKYVYAALKDIAGNISDYTQVGSSTIKLDATPPSFSGASINSGATSTTNTTVTYTVQVNESNGVGLASVTIDGLTPTSANIDSQPGSITGNDISFSNSPSDSSKTLTIEGTLSATNGEKTVSIIAASDRLGNNVSSPISGTSDTIILDTVAPSFSSATINSGAATTTTTTATYNVTLTETGSGLKTLTLSGSDFTPSGSVTGPGGNSNFTYSGNTITFDTPANLKDASGFTLSIPGTLSAGDGSKTISITGATDQAGKSVTGSPISGTTASIILQLGITSFSGLQSAISAANVSGTPTDIVISSNIEMTATIAVSGSITLKVVDGDFTLIRKGSSFKTALFSINGSTEKPRTLTLTGENGYTLTLDGGKTQSPALTATSALIKVPDTSSGTGYITINEGVILQNNKNTGDDGGAIYMNAGTLTMNGGIIRDNEVTGNSGYRGGSGGGLMLWDTNFTMNGGIIRNNSAYGASGSTSGGGGVYMEETTGTISFTMNGGIIGLNSTGDSTKGGGGVFLQAVDFTGPTTLYGAEIAGNTGVPQNLGYAGGGTILNEDNVRQDSSSLE